MTKDQKRIKELEKQLERSRTPVMGTDNVVDSKSTVDSELNKLSGALVDLQKSLYGLGERLNPITRHESSTISAAPKDGESLSSLLLTTRLINMQSFVGQIQAHVDYLIRNNIL